MPHNDLTILQGRRYYANGALNNKTDPNLMILSTNILRACLEMTFIVIKWRETKVVSYQKAENPESIGPKDFRPIKILSFVIDDFFPKTNNDWRL